MKSLVKVLGIQNKQVDAVYIEGGDSLKLPLCILPEGIKAGDVLRLDINYDPYGTLFAAVKE
ncbi:MAG TPA: hypothetical protein VFD33_05430 [Bacillota bacterium]|nr:hypothetical protein [Bacillota bacterium]